MIENIRGIVRPVVTFMVVLVLAIILCYLVFKFADKGMAEMLLTAFTTLVGTIIGFWFGSRRNPERQG